VIGARGVACAIVALAAVACGDDPDPCAGIGQTCVALRVEAADGAAIDAIDQLELDVLYGDRHATATTQPAAGQAAHLPLVTAITLADIATEIEVGVVAAGKLGGAVLGTGWATTPIARGTHEAIVLRLAPPAACVAASFYCGGDKIAGSADTLYECNAGGVPLARGRCIHGCISDPGNDDYCDGGPDACTQGGYYCGGDKVDGDPQTLYQCNAGAGVVAMECTNGCAVRPSPNDDACN